jgi:hypothetical protein
MPASRHSLQKVRAVERGRDDWCGASFRFCTTKVRAIPFVAWDRQWNCRRMASLDRLSDRLLADQARGLVWRAMACGTAGAGRGYSRMSNDALYA